MKKILMPDIAPEPLIVELARVNALDVGKIRRHGQWSSVRIWSQANGLNLAAPPVDVMEAPIMFETLVAYVGEAGSVPRTERVLFLPEGQTVQVLPRPFDDAHGSLVAHSIRPIVEAELHSCVRTCPPFRVEIVKGLNALFKAFEPSKH